MAKVFFDTYVLVHQLDKRDAKKQRVCRDLVREHALRGEAVISTQVLKEFYVAATGKLRIGSMLAKSILRTFENMELVTVGPDLIHEAIDTSVQHKVSLWDALVIVSAQTANCERLYTLPAWTRCGSETAGACIDCKVRATISHATTATFIFRGLVVDKWVTVVCLLLRVPA